MGRIFRLYGMVRRNEEDSSSGARHAGLEEDFQCGKNGRNKELLCGNESGDDASERTVFEETTGLKSRRDTRI